MTVAKKKLPNAILRSTESLSESTSVGPTSGENGRASFTAPLSVPSAHKTVEAGLPHINENLAPQPRLLLLHAASKGVREPDTARRRSQADAIVERHAIYSAIGGIVPVPIVNVATVAAIIVRMVKALSVLYNIPFKRDRVRTIVIGLMGGFMPNGLAAATTSTLFYIIPGSNLVGLAVSSVTAVACTRSIGQIFVEKFENGATVHEIGQPIPH
jgi:uncharacterized protein (DUF697 family)